MPARSWHAFTQHDHSGGVLAHCGPDDSGGDVSGSHRELCKRGVVETRFAYPDWTLVIEELVTEGDWVSARWRARGAHTGELEGVAPTGKRDEFVSTTVVRLVNGKIVELWKR
jgi:predicted ester cyclase